MCAETYRSVRRIIVLGGGSAGFMAALALKSRMPDMPVTLVHSKDLGIIGVGEGSTPNLTDFLHNYLHVNPKKFFQMANPTWKLGLKFVDWGPRPHFYYSFDARQLVAPSPSLRKPIGFYCDADMEHAQPAMSLMALNRAFERGADGSPRFGGGFSYHLENHKYVAFLAAFADAIGVRVVDDRVVQVLQDESGITGLVLASGRTESADLFVDCSGMASVLLGQALGEPFVPFKSSIWCDRAIVGGWTRGPGEPIAPYTTCTTMDAGWLWQIEHETRINRGYVYCSAFTSDDEAERAFRAASPKIGDARRLSFVSGRYERNWVKNVVAIGNASGFVEPLEATALDVIGNQSRLLTDALIHADRQIRPSHVACVNRHHQTVWDSIRGFIAIHYKYNTRLETPFWRECREHVDLGVGAAPAEYYAENGPCGFWGPMVVGPFDPFGVGGWITLLLGQRVPYRCTHCPCDQELRAFNAIRTQNRETAQRALTVEQTLAALRSPQARWN